ncbi:MAG: hypothetical protein Q8L14_33190 [Myxococcales bacterium]|nr:hypothetical protein [Myxococcales bacterium]
MTSSPAEEPMPDAPTSRCPARERLRDRSGSAVVAAVPLLLALFAGCLCVPPVTPIETSRLVVSPTTLDFGTTYLGQRVTRRLTMRNPSRVSRAVTWALEAPFAESFSGEVPPGESLEFDVTARPASIGLATATIDIDGTAVTLQVLGNPVPLCSPSAACLEASFDVTTERCVEQQVAEGTSCSTSCLTEGQCVNGSCVGGAAQCDDHDVCTVDACAVNGGCLHVPVACPAPSQCLTARCDPAMGCITDPVVDGVSCAPDDCAGNLAFVCINGTCVSRQRPQGTLCFETLAGVAAGVGHVDGQGDAVRFDQLQTGATDAWGTTWLVSRHSIRKMTTAGVVSTIRRAGPLEQFLPTFAVTDARGNLYFDEGRCLRKVTPLGQLIEFGTGNPCSVVGSTYFEALVVERDGRMVVASEGSLYEFGAQGLSRRLRSGRGPLQEAPGGELLFVDVADGGAMISRLGRDGGTTALRPWHGQLSLVAHNSPAPSLSPSGAAIVTTETDGGCVLSAEDLNGGLLSRRLASKSCYLSTTLARRTLGWAGRDESFWFLDESTQLSTLVDGAVRRVVGFVERPGDADGRGRDAGLRVNAGLQQAQWLDLLAVRKANTVTLVDADSSLNSRLREWSDDGGLITHFAYTTTSTTTYLLALQPADAGVWLLSTRGSPLGWTFWEPGSPATGSSVLTPPTTDVRRRGVLDETGSWLFGPELQRIDAQAQLVAHLAATPRTLRDGPLPAFLADGGLVTSTAGTAAFSSLTAGVSLGQERAAFIDANAVRLLTDAGFVTLAGGLDAGSSDGRGAAALFDGPSGIAWSPSQQLLYVADRKNFAIRTVSLAGDVRTIGRLSDQPAAVAVAPNGDVYVLVRHALLRGR